MTGTAGFERTLADEHAGYHQETRRHRRPDALVDDVVTWSMLSPHLMRAGLFLVAPTVLVVVWAVLGYLASSSGSDPVADAITSVVGLLAVVLYLAGVAALFAPAKEPIAEYSQLLEGRGAAAESAYDWVRRAAEARRAPAEVRPSAVGGVPVLVFAQHSERAMLLVQAYGNDLYVGWTMWRSRSSAVLLLHFLRDTFGRFGTGPRFSAELRAASTRALRESVHSLSREGVLAAVHAHRAPRRDSGAAAPPAAEHQGDPYGLRHSTPPAPSVSPTASAPRAGEVPAGGTDATRPRTGELAAPAPAAYDERALYTPRPDARPREHQPREHQRRDGVSRAAPRGDAEWGPPPRD